MGSSAFPQAQFRLDHRSSAEGFVGLRWTTETQNGPLLCVNRETLLAENQPAVFDVGLLHYGVKIACSAGVCCAAGKVGGHSQRRDGAVVEYLKQASAAKNAVGVRFIDDVSE